MSNRINKPNTDADDKLIKCFDNRTSFIMVAGAGSGKTTSLIKALAYIKDKYGNKLRGNSQKIACITYTKVATQEILHDVGNDGLLHVSTIHSFLWDIIKNFQADIKNWVINHIEEKKNKIQDYQKIKEAVKLVNKFNYLSGAKYREGIIGHSDIIKMVPELILNKNKLRRIIALKYPFFFIDESQDTDKKFIEAIKLIEKENNKTFCLGFFGDPMQTIYTTGTGKIEKADGWEEINKPENFRSPTSVLKVINNIRQNGDGLQQIIGQKDKPEGNAKIFIFPRNNDRDNNINKVRKYMAKETNDPLWLSDNKEGDVKLLVLVHRMAATRLGFGELYSIFTDKTSVSLKDDFTEDRSWLLEPFKVFIVPLLKAKDNKQDYEVVKILNGNCPPFNKEYINKYPSKCKETLSSTSKNIDYLAELFSKPNYTVKDALKLIHNKNLFQLDEKLTPYLEDHKLNIKEDAIITDCFNCNLSEILGYRKYMDDESVYSTQHGVKGAEFDRVLTIIDDETARFNLYSFDKYFNVKPLSQTDLKNMQNKEDSTIDRTRRLFYVCCSRAKKDLAVVYFTDNVELAQDAIKELKIFQSVITLDQLPP